MPNSSHNSDPLEPQRSGFRDVEDFSEYEIYARFGHSDASSCAIMDYQTSRLEVGAWKNAKKQSWNHYLEQERQSWM